jgi:hypothetical protein
MTATEFSAANLEHHLRRMRVLWWTFVALQPVTGVLLFIFPYRAGNQLLTPGQMTLLLAAAGLWLAFTANRDAKQRLAHAKHGYSVLGSGAKLLRDYLVVFMIVLLRLEAIAVCGVLTAIWGNGPLVALWFLVLAAILMLLTRPTKYKTKLLIERAESARREVND